MDLTKYAIKRENSILWILFMSAGRALKSFGRFPRPASDRILRIH